MIRAGFRWPVSVFRVSGIRRPATPVAYTHVEMKILATGAAGFIGSEYVRTLLSGERPGAGDVQVAVLDKLTYAGNLENLTAVAAHPGYRFVQGDICDAGLVEEIMPDHDVIVHFAAESHVDRSIRGAVPFVTTNVLGTQVLLDAALRHRV